jgi:hypothetical protein
VQPGVTDRKVTGLAAAEAAALLAREGHSDLPPGAPASGDLLRVAATSAELLVVLDLLRRIRSPSALR